MAQAIPFALLALTAVSTGVAIKGAKDSATAQEIALKEQANAESDAARQRELERKKALVQALSSQAAAGAGVTGAYGAIGRRDIRDASNDLATDRSNLARGNASLRARGRAARAGGNMQAIGLLASGAQSGIQNFPATKPTPRN